MKSQRIVTMVTAFALASGVAQAALFATPQQTATLAGTAKDEAKKGSDKAPYEGYSVRAREESQGTIVSTVPLNAEGNFTLPDLSMAKYIVELILTEKDGDIKIVCTEGPYDLTQQMLKNDIVIDCDRVPAGFYLISGAGLAGITAGVTATDTSPSR